MIYDLQLVNVKKSNTMALDTKKDSSVADERAFPPGESLRFVRPIKNLLELVPGPAIFWSLKRHFCIPNRRAHRWIATAKNDFREYASNWTRKIHRPDRPKFLSVWEQLQLQETVQCDYRFSPDSLEQEVWLREVSACYRSWRGEAEGLISVYTDVSDLKSEPLIEEADSNDEFEKPALQGLAHDIANCIHNISMELELMNLKSKAPAPVELLDSLNRLQWAIRQLLDCRIGQRPELVAASSRPVAEEMIRRFQRKLFPCGVELEFYSDETLPEIKIGTEALYHILEQLVDFYCAQLKAPAKLKVELRLVGGVGGEQLEVELSSPGRDRSVDDSVQPFLQIEDRRVSVSTTVAHEILRHHREKIAFAMPRWACGVLTLRFDVKQPAT